MSDAQRFAFLFTYAFFFYTCLDLDGDGENGHHTKPGFAVLWLSFVGMELRKDNECLAQCHVTNA